MNPYYMQQLERVLRRYRVKDDDADRAVLPDDMLDLIFYGTDHEQTFRVHVAQRPDVGVPSLVRRRRQQPAAAVQRDLQRLRQGRDREIHVGLDLQGLQRRAAEARSARRHASASRTSTTLTTMSVEQLERVLSRSCADRRAKSRSRIRSSRKFARGWDFSTNVGLEYLTLARSATTLSGGESQRIRLATQIGSALVGVLYILDEPSIGLHQRDNDRLLATLKTLRDLGNTLIVIEHDEDTMRNADVVVDIGPGAGAEGGDILTVGHARPTSCRTRTR